MDNRSSEQVVLITGAAGAIGTCLAHALAREASLSEGGVALHLHDVPDAEQRLMGLKMELEDSLYKKVHRIEIFAGRIFEACLGVDVVFGSASIPFVIGMERRDLLLGNAAIYKELGQAINKGARRGVKVLINSSPPNTLALVASVSAPNIPRKCFAALSLIDQWRAERQICLRLGCAPEQLHNVVVWGPHSRKTVVDISHAFVDTSHGPVPVNAFLQSEKDQLWLQGLQERVHNRGFDILYARKHASTETVARAAITTMNKWRHGTEPNEVISVSVFADKMEYGVSSRLCSACPVVSKKGEFLIAGDWKVGSRTAMEIRAGETELADEAAEVAKHGFLEPSSFTLESSVNATPVIQVLRLSPVPPMSMAVLIEPEETK